MQTAAATPKAFITATISTSEITTYKTTVKLPELDVPLLGWKAGLQCQNGSLTAASWHIN